MVPSQETGKTETVERRRGTAGSFHVLMDKAVESGMERRDFIQNCNKIQKRLNIDIGAAALIVLRDNGADIAPYVDMVYDSVKSA